MKTMQHGCCSLERAAILRCKGGKHSFLLRKLSFLFLFSFFVSPSFSNNIRITGTVKVSESSSHSDTLLLSFSLRWEHSWRDEFNWDAAWVFLKYKTASGAWQPVYLSPGGHRFTDASGSVLPFGSMEGETDGKTVGVFIYRTTLESGNTPEIRCHLLCPRSSLGGLPAEAFQRNEAFVLAQGIEMVYIPYGAYYAGDSSSFHTIADAGGHPILVDSEESVSVSTGGSSYTLSSSYPKGYKGFYMMKYEVSQEQYVTFLNNLTYTQQQERVPGLASFSKGDYIFGDASRPSCRNGIIVAVPSEGGRAVIFANNLNNDAKYSQSDNGKTLACNYLSPEDMIAYLSWSGLRPMSELEYEKACRAPYPEMPLEKEYAWHENGSLSFLASVSNGGSGSERSNTTGANVNAGNRFEGPVRCGLFATGSSSQRDAGASFWGVMEMSGNLRELCYNVSAANAFSGDVYGDGTYKRVNWSTVVSHFGVRGGGFSSEDSLLRVSDRSEAESYFTSLTQRDSTVGFRGVRPVSAISVDGGEIGASDTACWSGSEIRSIRDAGCTDMASLSFSYLWYVKKPGSSVYEIIPGEIGASLWYDNFVNETLAPVSYSFKRLAVGQTGVAWSNEMTLLLLGKPFDVADMLLNAGSSVAIPHLWGDAGVQYVLAGAPAWIYMDRTDNSAFTLAGGLACTNFMLNCNLTQCPEDIFSVKVRINGTFVYKGVEDSVTLAAGKYKMECWGANGGTYNSTSQGGNGAYVKGEISLSGPETFYIYVGQSGNAFPHASPDYTYNGGARGSNCMDCAKGNYYGKSSGGASDIRLKGGNWKDFESLKSRIMVAAGGSGGYYYGSVGGRNGSHGGGINGYDGSYKAQSGAEKYTVATGATQTAGGMGGIGTADTNPLQGSFGYGAYQRKYTGGSGGYYGGGGGGESIRVMGTGSTGSSFISGHAGCDAITAESTEGTIVHTGQPYHYSGKYFTRTVMVDGAGYQWTDVMGNYSGMPDVTGNATVSGNAGNGQVRITPVP